MNYDIEEFILELKGSQKRYLRGLANTLKPMVFIGRNGLTDQVLDAIDQSLDSHELIKVRFHEFKEMKKELCREIAEKCQCDLAGMVGHVAIFYRQHPDPEKRKISLPQ